MSTFEGLAWGGGAGESVVKEPLTTEVKGAGRWPICQAGPALADHVQLRKGVTDASEWQW